MFKKNIFLVITLFVCLSLISGCDNKETQENLEKTKVALEEAQNEIDALKKANEDLVAQNKQFTENKQLLQTKLDAQTKELEKIKGENISLKHENGTLIKQLSSFEIQENSENAIEQKWQEKFGKLAEANRNLDKELTLLRDQNAQLEQRIDEDQQTIQELIAKLEQ